MKITVIVPTLNNTKGLKYLQSYFSASKNIQLIIIDNSKKNLGFAAGVNKGAKDVKSKWLLILNDDIVFKDKISNTKSQITNRYQNTLETLVKYAEANKLDAVTPILRNPNGKVENFGYEVLPFGKIQLFKEKTDEKKIDGITAACLLVKTSVFKKLNGFDESFFAYLEDVDFFLRFKENGYKMGIAPIEVLHNHMTTSKTMGNFKARQDMINWWKLCFKHPNKFNLDFQFLLERIRNISGYIKATFEVFNKK